MIGRCQPFINIKTLNFSVNFSLKVLDHFQLPVNIVGEIKG
jgi:hypothetical protein